MASKKLHEPQTGSTRPSVATDANEWLMKFGAVFERSFLEESLGLRENADIADFQNATVRAMVHTLIDSGMSSESLVDRVAQTLVDIDPVDVRWSPKRNSRKDGISQSCFMRRERGELPPEY